MGRVRVCVEVAGLGPRQREPRWGAVGNGSQGVSGNRSWEATGRAGGGTTGWFWRGRGTETIRQKSRSNGTEEVWLPGAGEQTKSGQARIRSQGSVWKEPAKNSDVLTADELTLTDWRPLS